MPVIFNISGFDAVKEKLNGIDIKKLCFTVASTLKAEVRHRVHVEGKASDGSLIGTYSKGYLVLRSGSFQDSKTRKRGKRKGQVTNAGKYSKGSNTGAKRTMYKRGADPKVILSLTRQMENDMNATEPIPLENGYGIGYSNEFNYNKAVWNEARYKKPIWNLTEEEKALAQKIVGDYVKQING